jgi:hypothetical protein
MVKSLATKNKQLIAAFQIEIAAWTWGAKFNPGAPRAAVHTTPQASFRVQMTRFWGPLIDKLNSFWSFGPILINMSAYKARQQDAL